MRSNDRWIEDVFADAFSQKTETPPNDDPSPKTVGDLYDEFFMTADSVKFTEMKTELEAQEDIQRKAAQNAMWKQVFADAKKVRETALTNAKEALQNAFSQKGDPRKTCGLCGGYLSIIRGRYPKSDNRVVCPTCLADRMENINEISGKNYGVASQNK
jgi:hypothetical protein